MASSGPRLRVERGLLDEAFDHVVPGRGLDPRGREETLAGEGPVGDGAFVRNHHRVQPERVADHREEVELGDRRRGHLVQAGELGVCAEHFVHDPGHLYCRHARVHDPGEAADCASLSQEPFEQGLEMGELAADDRAPDREARRADLAQELGPPVEVSRVGDVLLLVAAAAGRCLTIPTQLTTTSGVSSARSPSVAARSVTSTPSTTRPRRKISSSGAEPAGSPPRRTETTSWSCDRTWWSLWPSMPAPPRTRTRLTPASRPGPTRRTRGAPAGARPPA